MEQTPPEVSVIVTSYNYARFVGRAVKSACDQRVDGMEIVVVDNASTDDSWEIIQDVAASDDRVRAFRNEQNIGMIGNHNRALELARGRRVLFLSADDYLLPGHVARLVEAHRQHPNIDLMFTSYVRVDEAERFLHFWGHVGHLRGRYFGGRNEFADILLYDSYMCTPTTLWEREELLSGGGFDPNITAGDLELYLRMAARGKRFGFLDVAGVCVRLHEHEMTSETNYVATGKQLTDHLYLLERYLVPENQRLIAGREHGIARLLNMKIANLNPYPETKARVLGEQQARINAVAARLNAFLEISSQAALPPMPRIGVIVLCSDDVQGTLEAIDMIAAQGYQNLEVVLAMNSRFDVSELLVDRARALTTKTVFTRGVQTRPVVLNDALRLCEGDIVTYCEPSIRWPANHLQRLANHFSQGKFEAVVVPADVVIHDGGALLSRENGFAGTPVAQAGAQVGEAVPISTLAHKRAVFDRLGNFDERFAYTSEFDFVRRLFQSASLALDSTGAIEIYRRADAVHPAGQDPSGYLAALRATYAARPGAAELQPKITAHLERLSGELAKTPIDAQARLRLWSLVRGIEA